MPRKHVVRELTEEQFTFVVESILDGRTDAELCAAFESRYGAPLAKSSLRRWRNAAGDEMASEYRLARYQARKIAEGLTGRSDITQADIQRLLMADIDHRLLARSRELLDADPVGVLKARQEERKIELRKADLFLKAEALRIDRDRIALQRDDAILRFLELLSNFIGDDPAGLAWYAENAEKLREFISRA